MSRSDTTRAKPEGVERVDINDLLPDPANLRRRDDRAKNAIRSSVARFGPGRSIVLDGNGVVVAGNGTLEAAKAEGVTDVLVVDPKPGQLVAVRRRDWTATEATAYGIADNRLADLADYDDTALAETLRALQSDQFDLDAVGFSEAEIDSLCGRLGGEVVDDPEAEWEGMPEFEHEDLASVQSVIVHFATREDAQAFAELIGQKVSDKTKWLWFPERERVPYGVVQESPVSDLRDIEREMGEAANQQGS